MPLLACVTAHLRHPGWFCRATARPTETACPPKRRSAVPWTWKGVVTTWNVSTGAVSRERRCLTTSLLPDHILSPAQDPPGGVYRPPAAQRMRARWGRWSNSSGACAAPDLHAHLRDEPGDGQGEPAGFRLQSLGGAGLSTTRSRARVLFGLRVLVGLAQPLLVLLLLPCQVFLTLFVLVVGLGHCPSSCSR